MSVTDRVKSAIRQWITDAEERGDDPSMDYLVDKVKRTFGAESNPTHAELCVRSVQVAVAKERCSSKKDR